MVTKYPGTAVLGVSLAYKTLAFVREGTDSSVVNLSSSGKCHPVPFHGVPEAPCGLWEVRVISSGLDSGEEAGTGS